MLAAVSQPGCAPLTGSSQEEEEVCALRSIVGTAPCRYLRQLLADGAGDVTRALAIHFEANGGSVPAVFTDQVSHAERTGDGAPVKEKELAYDSVQTTVSRIRP